MQIGSGNNTGYWHKKALKRRDSAAKPCSCSSALLSQAGLSCLPQLGMELFTDLIRLPPKPIRTCSSSSARLAVGNRSSTLPLHRRFEHQPCSRVHSPQGHQQAAFHNYLVAVRSSGWSCPVSSLLGFVCFGFGFYIVELYLIAATSIKPFFI